jgi:hypothetical protein
MMKRRYLVAIPALVAIAWIGVRCWPDAGGPLARPEVNGLAIAEQAAQREAANRLANMPPPPSLASTAVGKFSAETIHSVEDKFRRMVAVRGLITEERERRSLAQAILATVDGGALVREILLDPELARAAFGSFQAEARFYAITVLDEAARQGDLDVVVDTASDLAAQLVAAGGAPDKGRSEDLTDIAVIIGANLGTQGLLDPGSQALAKIGYAPDLPAPVRRLYIDGLFQGVWKAEGIESAQAMNRRLIAL